MGRPARPAGHAAALRQTGKAELDPERLKAQAEDVRDDGREWT
ncbi:hypothetical protein [Xanthomonas campestris]|nr:hypothetical protein [Xanthomonas campestris]